MLGQLREFTVSSPRRLAGLALQFASETLRADTDVVLDAVWQNVYSMKFAAMELKEDRSFILKAAQTVSLLCSVSPVLTCFSIFTVLPSVARAAQASA